MDAQSMLMIIIITRIYDIGAVSVLIALSSLANDIWWDKNTMSCVFNWNSFRKKEYIGKCTILLENKSQTLVYIRTMLWEVQEEGKVSSGGSL